MMHPRVSRRSTLIRATWLSGLIAAAVTVAVSGAPGSAPEGGTSTRTITFRPGRSYEVTGIWLEKDRLPDLHAYFAKVFPIAAKDYGVRPLFSLEPVSAYAGDFLPQVLFVNEWPSLASFQEFISDPRATALFPERDSIVDRLVVTQYEAPQESTVTLSEGDVVEFAAMWIKEGSGPALQAYYEQVIPIAVRHGFRPLTPLRPVFSYKGGFLPNRSALSLWGTLANFDAFAKEASPLFAQRDRALERLEVTHARVRFEGGG